MAATDCSKTPRSKSIKARALTLRDHEARKLAEDGRVLVVREVDAPQFGPNSGEAIREVVPSLLVEPGLWDVRYDLDNPHAVRCPLGPVGSPLWGREMWAANATLNLRRPSELQGETIYYRAAYDNDSHFMWRSSVLMPRHASRFPRLRHESCEVKRVRDMVASELEQTGMYPSSEEAVRMANRSPDVWLGCSLVVDIDRLEVADA